MWAARVAKSPQRSSVRRPTRVWSNFTRQEVAQFAHGLNSFLEEMWNMETARREVKGGTSAVGVGEGKGRGGARGTGMVSMFGHCVVEGGDILDDEAGDLEKAQGGVREWRGRM